MNGWEFFIKLMQDDPMLLAGIGIGWLLFNAGSVASYVKLRQIERAQRGLVTRENLATELAQLREALSNRLAKYLPREEYEARQSQVSDQIADLYRRG